MDDSPVPRSAPENTTTTFADTVIAKPDLSNKENKQSDNWHDFSQISVEEEKHKLTPLSQSGFRDPASTGGGQQLTLLSIEVLSDSFLFRTTRKISSFFVLLRSRVIIYCLR
jgi:DNA polymerase zeta